MHSIPASIPGLLFRALIEIELGISLLSPIYLASPISARPGIEARSILEKFFFIFTCDLPVIVI